MTTVDASDYPALSFGALGHPGIGAWPWVERQKGVYDFSMLDSYVNQAIAHGLVDANDTVNVSITIGFTPQFYATYPKACTSNNRLGATQCTVAPANVQDWSNYVTALVKHYNGVTAPHIRYYELWNEANIKLYWTGNTADLVKLAQAAYPIIHTDPYSSLLTPSVAGPVGDVAQASGSTWMAAYLDAGGKNYADGGVFHGYIAEQKGLAQYPMPDQDTIPGCKPGVTCYGSIVTKANTMRQVFNQHGLAGKPMFDTEGSWGDGTITDADTQAAWLARWYLLQAGLRSTDNLQMAIWFTWGDPTSFKWGTIETVSKQPNQAGMAYTQIYNWLVGSKIEPCSASAAGMWSCAITLADGKQALAVWALQGTQSYTPAAAYVDYRDLGGNTVKVDPGVPVILGVKPILLETSQSSQGTP
jgi:hypothetical protein